jgi:hypothetical protein
MLEITNTPETVVKRNSIVRLSNNAAARRRRLIEASNEPTAKGTQLKTALLNSGLHDMFTACQAAQGSTTTCGTSLCLCRCLLLLLLYAAAAAAAGWQ